MIGGLSTSAAAVPYLEVAGRWGALVVWSSPKGRRPGTTALTRMDVPPGTPPRHRPLYQKRVV